MNVNKLFVYEFFRYVLVGGISTVIDIGVLSICLELLLPEASYALYLATAFGFLAGLITNYCLSLTFVFTSAKGKGKAPRDIILFLLIGIVGLLLSETGMWFGSTILSLHYLIIKTGVTLVVLIWNYLARKFFIFQSSGGK